MNPFGGSPAPKMRVSDVERLINEGFTHLLFYPATNFWSAGKSDADARRHAETLANYADSAPWRDQYVVYPLCDVLAYRPAFVSK